MAKKPWGDKVREMIQPAIDDERRPTQQLKILDNALGEIVPQLPQATEQHFRKVFNKMASAQSRSDADKNELLIDMMTRMERGPSGWQKQLTCKMDIIVPVSIEFAEFNASDVSNCCPNLVKIHEWARENDVSVKLQHLTKADSIDGRLPVMLSFDFGKTYDECAVDPMTPALPDLPPPPRKITGGKRFKAD